MLLVRLERVDGEYVLRIPRHEIVQHDLREGQLLAVIVEPLADFGGIEGNPTKRGVENWKLNEVDEHYEPDT